MLYEIWDDWRDRYEIKKFFEKYFGIDNSNNENEEFKYNIAEDDSEGYLDMVAEEDENYNYKSDKEENVWWIIMK